MNNLSYLLLLFFFTSQLHAQPWFSKSIDVENQNNNGWQVLLEGEELILASPNYCDTSQNNVCTFIIKTDLEGNIIDYTTIQNRQLASYRSPIIKTSDSTYHVYAFAVPSENENLKFIQLNADLQIEQEWAFGSEQNDENPTIWVQNENGYLISSFSVEDAQYVVWLTQLSNEVEIVHQVMFPEQENDYGFLLEEGLIATQDNHFIATGRIFYEFPNAQGITKLDENLEVVWHTRVEKIPIQANDDTNILELENGSIVMNWEVNNTTNPLNDSLSLSFATIVNLDGASGDTLWSTVLWMPRPSHPFIYKLNRANNGDIIGMGQMYQPSIPEEWPEHQEWRHSGFIFRMSPEGELKWKRYILDVKSPLAEFSNLLDSEELPNGDLLFTGVYYDTFPNADPFINDINIWLVRTDSMGCLTPGCGELQIVNADGSVLTATEEEGIPNKDALAVRVYPNPAREHWMLDWRYPEEAQLQVTDLQGWVLYEQMIRSGPQKIPAKALPSGLYLFNIQSEDRSGSLKVMKIE